MAFLATGNALADRPALAAWLREAGLAPTGTPVGSADLDAALRLRSALAAVLGAAAGGAPAAPEAIAAVNAAAARCAAPQLDASTGMPVQAPATVSGALARLAAEAVELLARSSGRLCRCALPGCGALLLSNSTGPRRRWCTMEGCGNVAKARAYRARRKGRPPA